MKELLDRFDAVLARERPDYFDELAPGVSNAELAGYEARLGVTLPDEVRAFYMRHDGQARDYFAGLWYNRTLMDLDLVVHTHAGWNELRELGEFEQPNWWNPLWIPFAENGAADYYLIDLAGCFGGQPGQIVEVWHGDEDRGIFWPSFASWLETIVAAHEQGYRNLDADEVPFEAAQSDEAIYEAVYARLNPGYPRSAAASDSRGSAEG